MQAEFDEFERNSLWYSVYQDIKDSANKYDHPAIDFKKPENRLLNRYSDVYPFDHTRIRLKRCTNDYINANLLMVESAERAYILTQGPLNNTIAHFWLMIWEQNSTAIVMLNKIYEKGQIKCSPYWPNAEQEEILSTVSLKVRHIREEDSQNYIIRTFQLTDLKGNGSRLVKQYHYISWPDFGIPESPTSFLDFLYCIQSKGDLNDVKSPPVIHCSAGIGRTGTFCLVDACLQMIKKGKQVNIRKMLLEMRHYRRGLIQTPEQLRFSYMAIIEGSETISQEPCSPGSKQNRKRPAEEDDCQDVNKREKNKSQSSNSPVGSGSKSSSSSSNVSSSPTSSSTSPSSNSSSNITASANNYIFVTTEGSTSAMKTTTTITTNDAAINAAARSAEKSELRKRTREERNRNLEKNIERMKKTMRETEERLKFRKSMMKYALGVLLVLGTGLFAYNYGLSPRLQNWS